MKKMLFLMNPYAGQRKANKHLADILLLFSQASYVVNTIMTTGPGSATQAAQTYGSEVDLVVCCGGDGTLNETITGLMRAGVHPPVGYIPAGTTNDFAASLKLSHTPLQAARDILEGAVVDYDVGRFDERYFSYVASFGAFTQSSYSVPQSVKNALGHAAYVLGGISELSQIKNEHIRMEIDGEVVEDDYLFGAVCNSVSIGGVLNLDPKLVDMSDGIFEVLLLRAPRSLAEITECIQAVQSQKYNCAMITFRTARRILVQADPSMPWTLDGERADGRAEFVIENIPRNLHLVQRKADS